MLFLSTAHSEYTDRPNRMKMTCILSTKLPQLAKRANSRLMVKTDGAGSWGGATGAPSPAGLCVYS